MLLLTRLTPTGSYAADVLPSLILIGVGMGSVFAPSIGTATLGVETHEAGVASALVNTSQQVGGSVGTALLSTIFASAAASFASSHAHLTAASSAAAIHGEVTAFSWSAGIFALGLLVATFILPTPPRWRRRRPGDRRSQPGAQPTVRLNPRPRWAPDRGRPNHPAGNWHQFLVDS